MTSSFRTVALSAGFLLALAASVRAAAVAVYPTCGDRHTHFTLAASGFIPPDNCDTCATFYTVSVNGSAEFDTSSYGTCFTSFTVDLKRITDKICSVCPLPFGVDTVTVSSVVECSGGFPAPAPECQQAIFTVANSTSDPWANDQLVGVEPSGRATMHIKFDPSGSCGLPDCDELHLIQSVRVTFVTGADSECVSLDQFPFRWSEDSLLVARYKATVTDAPECTLMDRFPESFAPYCNEEGGSGHVGRIGAVSDTCTCDDSPSLPVSPSVDELLAEFEVDAYCAAGPGRGRFLGRTFWLYEHFRGDELGSIRRDPRRGADQLLPDSRFVNAFNLFQTKRLHPLSKFHPPSEGGIRCPGQ